MGWRKQCIIAVGFLLGGAVFAGCAGIGTAWEDLEKSKGSAKLVFTGPSTFTVSDCAAFSASLQSSSGSPATLSESKVISFSSTSGLGNFYSDASCLTLAPSVTIPAGSTSATIYYKDSNGNGATPTLTATTPGLPSVSIIVTVNGIA